MGIEILVGLGGNLGDVPSVFEAACRRIGADVSDLVLSRFYVSLPRYDKPGAERPDTPDPPYINAVFRGRTDLSPEALLGLLQAAEAAFGRCRSSRACAPRTLDLDILLYGTTILETPDLWIPHPRMHTRGFVLWPACDVAADWHHPGLGKTLLELRDSCGDEAPRLLA